MDSITLKAYAKINLYLDVTGRRSDGYHLLETVMHTISLHDTVTITKGGDGIVVSCSDPSIPCNEKNIAFRCASAFFEKTGIKNTGISIAIDKLIPSQAGMGGGSADGAAVFKGLNFLFGAGLSESALCDIAAGIGADIPFCIVGGCGYCTGIGEIIEPLRKLTGYAVIGKGSKGISTAEAYAHIDNCGMSIEQPDVKKIFSGAGQLKDIAPYCRNIFDEVTKLDEVNIIKKIMTDNAALCSCMTGSGSAVFGLYEDLSVAENVLPLLKDSGYFAEICEFI